MLPDINVVTREDLVRLTMSHRLRLNRKLSQHFVIEPLVIKDIINHVPVNSRVLEIGTGIGILTFYLASVASQVVTIEIDGRLVKIAGHVLNGLGNVSIIQGDALRVPWPQTNIVVSNVPYSITSPLIMRIIRERVPGALLTIQREVANRLAGEPGSDYYGRLSIVTQCNYVISILNTYPPDYFYPNPDVYSSLVLMVRKEPCYGDIKTLESVTNLLFRHRNRVLRWVLGKYLGSDSINAAIKVGININVRVRQLTVNELVSLTEALRPYIIGNGK